MIQVFARIHKVMQKNSYEKHLYWFTKFVAISVFLTVLGTWSNATAQEQVNYSSVSEDSLDTSRGLPWAGRRGWPYSRRTEILDSLVETSVGRIVLDRYGTDGSNSFLSSPFTLSRPGRMVIFSMWVHKYEGCAVELIVQNAPVGGVNNNRVPVPIKFQIGVNLGEGNSSRIISLEQSADSALAFMQDFTYTEYDGDRKYERTSQWYFARQIFSLDSVGANLLRNTIPEETRARITFSDGTTKVFPIGKGTVESWPYVYGFQPSCAV